MDHTLAEKIVKEAGSDMFVVWWTFDANYSEPQIVVAKDPKDAWDKTFPKYKHSTHPDFHKYVVAIQNGGKFHDLSK